MTIVDVIVQSSVQVLVVNKEGLKPNRFGTGCILKYKDRFFLFTAAHVTDVHEASTCIVTNQPNANKQMALYSLGAMNYFDEYSTRNIMIEEVRSLDELLKDFEGTVDVAFCELKEKVEIIQP
ncbi:MAG TPA: hypothetical protein VF646_02705, partial [Cytophagales bacterium]